MAYDAFKLVDVDTTKLAFPSELCNYVYRTGKGKNVGKVYKLDQPTYKAIKKIFAGDENHQVSKGDKVYVLPGHTLGKERIKAALKKIGATMTSDINKATAIAGTKGAQFNTTITAIQAPISAMLFHTFSYRIKINNGLLKDDIFSKVPNSDEVEAEFNEGTKCYITLYSTDHKLRNHDNIEVTDGFKYLIRPEGMAVVYNILSRRLKVFTEDVITDHAHSDTKLEDDAVYEGICNMLASGDKDNKSLAIQTLTRCDLSGDIEFKIWKLTQIFHNIPYANRTKALDMFITKSRWKHWKNLDKQDFLIHREQKNKLTPAIIEYCLSDVKEEIVSNLSDVILDFDRFYEMDASDPGNITIKYKKKWSEIVEANQLTAQL